MALYTVTVSGRERAERSMAVRVTEAQITAAAEERRSGLLPPISREALGERIARQRAAVRMYGKAAIWRTSGAGSERTGQVWLPCRTGGENAATGTIRMDVS
jgi:hypothetical protein